MEVIELLGITLLLIGVIWAAISDFRSMRIPNTACATVAIGAVIYGVGAPQSIDWMGVFLVGGITFAIGFLLFAFKFLGGGDAKLLAAVALWAGPEHIFDLVLATALAGGALAIIWISPLKFLLLHVSPGLSGPVASAGEGEGQTKAYMPYALAIAVGAFVIMPDIPLL